MHVMQLALQSKGLYVLHMADLVLTILANSINVLIVAYAILISLSLSLFYMHVIVVTYDHGYPEVHKFTIMHAVH